MKFANLKKCFKMTIVSFLLIMMLTCTVQAKDFTSSQLKKFSDYPKIEKLIRCFNTPVGFMANPAMKKEKSLKKISNNFIVAVSAWNVNEKYWKDFRESPYGVYSIQNKYVLQNSKMLFNKSCSLEKYPRFSDDYRKSKSYLNASSWKNNVIVYGYSSPYTVSSKIKKISQLNRNTCKVYVTYYAKDAYTKKTKETMKMEYTVKKKSALKYGYYVTNVKEIGK